MINTDSPSGLSNNDLCIKQTTDREETLEPLRCLILYFLQGNLTSNLKKKKQQHGEETVLQASSKMAQLLVHLLKCQAMNN